MKRKENFWYLVGIMKVHSIFNRGHFLLKSRVSKLTGFGDQTLLKTKSHYFLTMDGTLLSFHFERNVFSLKFVVPQKLVLIREDSCYLEINLCYSLTENRNQPLGHNSFPFRQTNHCTSQLSYTNNLNLLWYYNCMHCY